MFKIFVNYPKYDEEYKIAETTTAHFDPTVNQVLSGEEIVNLLFELNRRHGTTLVIVTHDLELSRRAHRIVHLTGGRVDRIEEVEALG